MTTESVSSQANLLQQASCTLPVTLVTKNNSSKIIIPCIRYKECSTVVYMPKFCIAYQQAWVAGMTNNIFSDKVKVKTMHCINNYSSIKTFFSLLGDLWAVERHKQLEDEKHRSQLRSTALNSHGPSCHNFFHLYFLSFLLQKNFSSYLP